MRIRVSLGSSSLGSNSRNRWEEEANGKGEAAFEQRLASAEGSYSKWRENEARWLREQQWKAADRLMRHDPTLSAVFEKDDGLSATLFQTLLLENVNRGDGGSFQKPLATLLNAATRVAKREAREGFYARAQHRLEKASSLKGIASIFEKGPLDSSQGRRKPAEVAFEANELQSAIQRSEALEEQVGATLAWLRGGLAALPVKREAISRRPGNRNTLYLTFGSLPFRLNGNASRTHGLLTAATQEGWNVRCLTRPGFPLNLDARIVAQVESLSPTEPWEHSYRWEGVTYTNLRVKEAKNWRYHYQRQFDFWVEAAIAMAKRDQPALLHGASNFLIGAAAIHAADRLGLPGIYEMRGMWWLDFAALNPSFVETEEYQRMAAFEIEIAQRASHVFAISKGIREFLLSKGIANEKISLLPNGVNPQRFQPGAPDPALVAKHHLEGQTVIGFVGTLADYEGVEYLLEAARILLDRGCRTKFKVLIIGDGPERARLLELIRTLKLEETILYLPPVPFNTVQEYIRLIDIIAIPRPAHAICERVTPIKPFEAMVMGKTVVGSSVGGIKEIIEEGVTGLIHEKENAISLADQLERALGDRDLRLCIGEEARNFVLQNHDWRQIIRRSMTPVYERLTEGERTI